MRIFLLLLLHQHTKMRRLKIFLFTVFVFLFLFTKLVKAQSLGLSIYPPLLEVTIMPGKTITQVYKLSNPGEIDLMMTSSIVSFEPSDEIGGIKFVTDTEQLKPISFSFLNADLKLGQTFPLPTGSTQEIVLIIKVPETAPEKDYYATLLFQTAPMKGYGALSASQTQTKIGANLLITVSRTGEPIKKAKIEEFALQRTILCRSSFCFIDSFTQPEFFVKIKNAGHSYFKPLGEIFLQGWFKQEETLDLLPQNILSGFSREIQCQIDDRVTPCQVKSKFLIGPFRAKLEFGLDDFSEEYHQEIRFIALPIKLVLALFALTIILWLIKSKLRLDKV